MPLMGVLADDLTGAMAAAATLRQRGISTAVQWGDVTAENAEAVVVNMTTRENDAPRFFSRQRAGPRVTARRYAEDLLNLKCRRIQLRVDSMLHGHGVHELDGVLDAYGDLEPVVYAAPAWPAAARITRDQRQVWFNSDGTDGEADLRTSLLGSKRSAATLEPPADDGVDETVNALLRLVDSGTRCFIAAASEDAHLRAHALVVAELEARDIPVVTVSSGAWLRYFPTVVDIGKRREFTLVALVSSSPVTQRQLEELQVLRPRTVVMTPAEAMAWTWLRDDEVAAQIAEADTIVICDRDDERDTDAGLCAAEKAAEAVRLILEAAHTVDAACRGIVASGGFTAWKITEELADSRTLEPVRMIAPLCALGRISGGKWSGLSIVTKGGWTGDTETLVQLVDHLRTHHSTFFRNETDDFPAVRPSG